MHLHRLHAFLFLILLSGMTAAQALGQNLASADQLRNSGKYREAIAAYEKLRQAQPNDAEVLWRLARARVDLGETVSNKKEQETIYRAALTDAEAAIKANARNAQAHLAVAIAAGRVGLISPTKQKIELSRKVKESVDQALRLDPNEPTAYHVRGRWNYEVASLGFMEKAVVKVVYGGLPTATYELAAKDFQKAIQIEDRVINHLELGKTYIKIGDKVKAKAELQKTLATANTDPDDPGHKREAQQLIGKL